MRMIDDRGRLFGALNLIDALLVVFALGVVPLGYVAYRVFRVPPPQIDTIEPASQPEGANLRLRIRGRDLRPYLRVWINKTGTPFGITLVSLASHEVTMLVETPTAAEGVLPINLPPASYDLYLFDGTHELARRVAAFTITPPPARSIDAVVRFAVDEALVPLVKTGDRDSVASAGRPAIDGRGAELGAVRASGQPATPMDVQVGGVVLHIPARLVEATVAIPAQKSAGGIWEYRGKPVRPGDPFIFETDRYTMSGLVLQVRPAGDAPPAGGGGASR
jgi:hypothetical protein